MTRDIIKLIIFVLTTFNAYLWKYLPSVWIVKLLSHFNIISFDVFDTLIFRSCKTPNNVFRIIEKEINIKNFSYKRIAAEKLARLDKEHYEVNLDDIYNKYSELNSNEDVNYLKKYEMLAEKKVIIPNYKLLEIYSALLLQNKKIILMSDMYLSKEYICELLRLCGYKTTENIFISNEYGRSKRSGRLQKYVGHVFGDVKCIHIGDNLRSDVIKSYFNGWWALWYSHL